EAALRWRLEDQDADVRRAAYLISLFTRPKLVETLRERDPELQRQLSELETFGKQSAGGKAVDPQTAMAMSLAELGLSVRATNTLESGGLATIRDLVTRSEGELRQQLSFGGAQLKELKQKLAAVGLALAGETLPGKEEAAAARPVHGEKAVDLADTDY